MAMDIKKLKPKSKGKQTKEKKHRANWLLRFTLLVIAIPLAILAWILLTSLETKGEPVIGERFENQLDTKISKEQETSVKQAFTSDEIESIEVNLKSATLRISINTIDTLTMEQIDAMLNDAYTKVDAILPVATYFTNKVDGEKQTKMYDLEIHVFNYIPNDENRAGYIYKVLTKNAASSEYVKNTPSHPIDEEVVKTILERPKEGTVIEGAAKENEGEEVGQ